MYRVTLFAISSNHIKSIRQIRIALRLGLMEAKNLIEKADLPFVMLDGVDLETASRVKEIIEAAGALVDITESNYPQPMIFYRPDFEQQSLDEIKSPVIRGLLGLFKGFR
ncbi:MAG: ribosomal protein L7/L12 [Armatimonadota bacterium]